MEQQFYSQVDKLDKAINEQQITEVVAQDTIRLLETDTELSNYFFKNVQSLQWFSYLSVKGYFLPNKISYDHEGNAFFWNVLDYLERVSEQVAQNAQYGKELINIIESIVDFSLCKKRINSYHIWWYCVKILNNIPASMVRDDLSLAGFSRWVSTWTYHSMGSDLAIADIGEKLLPKFLNETSTIEYAETIIDVITRIKAGDKSTVSIVREDARLAWDSYWIRDAFRKNHQLIGQKCSANAVLTIADKLRKALEYGQKRHHSNIRIGEDAYRIEISRIPLEEILAEKIAFKQGEYDCVVKQFTQDQLKGMTPQDEAGDLYLYNTEPKTERERFTFKAFTITDFMKAIRENLSQDVEWMKAEDFEKQLWNLFDGLHSDYSHIWCGSLAQGPEFGDDAKEVLTVVLRDVLVSKCEASQTDGAQVLDALLSDQYLFPIFRRFVLLCVDKFWAYYAAFLDRFFDVVPNALDESDLEVELQDVLRNHNADFNAPLKERLRKLINDDVPEYYVKKGNELTAYWKYKWFSPLRENPEFSLLYEEAKETVRPKDGKPYEVERSAIKGGFVVHKSPLSKEDILQRPIRELVRYLNDFEGADFWHGTFEDEPDRRGLADALQAAVNENPAKFTDEMNAFLGVRYFYVHQVLGGLEKAWKADKDIDWETVFGFAIKYFERDKAVIVSEALQEQGEDSGGGKYIWVIDDIVDLIADGCRDDKRAFDPQYLDKAERIFELVAPLLKGEEHPDTQRDALTYAMNTTLGRAVRGYISLALRKARVTQHREESWGQKRYEPFFAIGVEAHIWFGCYLPQMKYLDEKYTRQKIEAFAKRPPDDFAWRMFMEGYLQGAQVYPELYSLMRINYVTALESKLFDERIDQRLVEHIALGYLHFGEKLEEVNIDGKSSLFWKMLAEAAGLDKRHRWLRVASFFWSLTGRTINKEEGSEKETSEEIRSKILEFWAWTFNKQDFVKTNSGDDYSSFLGQMAGLTILIDRIDADTEKWLLLCAPHLDRYHNATSFIEYLTKFEDEESIKRIGKIFLKVLENTTPTFRQEDIGLVVDRIYDKGDRNDAEVICNTYGRRGIHFLKPVWEKHQKS